MASPRWGRRGRARRRVGGGGRGAARAGASGSTGPAPAPERGSGPRPGGAGAGGAVQQAGTRRRARPRGDPASSDQRSISTLPGGRRRTGSHAAPSPSPVVALTELTVREVGPMNAPFRVTSVRNDADTFLSTLGCGRRRWADPPVLGTELVAGNRFGPQNGAGARRGAGDQDRG